MQQAKPRLFILVTQLERGGAQKIALRLAHYFALSEYVVTFCTFYTRDSFVVELETSPFQFIDFSIQPAAASRRKRLALAIRAFWRLYKLLATDSPDVVLTFTHYSNMIGMLLAWLARVPVRIASHRSLLADRPAWFIWLHGWILNSRATTHVVAVSKRAAAMYTDKKQLSTDKLSVIHNGIELDKYRISQEKANSWRQQYQIAPDAIILVTVARLSWQKGYADLVEASRRLVDRHPAIQFVWAGGGAIVEPLQAMVEAAGLEGHVTMLGPYQGIPTLLAAADIFVLPTLTEGFPNAVLEAMAAGLPVVATNVGGIPEIITSPERGLLIPPANVDALVKTIQKLIGDEDLQQRLGAAARHAIEVEFRDEMMCQRFEQVIMRLLRR